MLHLQDANNFCSDGRAQVEDCPQALFWHRKFLVEKSERGGIVAAMPTWLAAKQPGRYVCEAVLVATDVK